MIPRHLVGIFDFEINVYNYSSVFLNTSLIIILYNTIYHTQGENYTFIPL